MRFIFLTLPDYSQVALSSAIDVLCLANQLGRRPVYSWQLASLDGVPVPASNGQCMEPTVAVSEVSSEVSSDAEPVDIIFVCGGSRTEQALVASQHNAKRHVRLDSVDAGVDVLLTLIREQQGAGVASRISFHLNLCRVHGFQKPQTLPNLATLGAYRENLMEAVALMDSNLDEPLPLEDISRLVGTSLRQIERLFKIHLGDTPSQYYLRKRLDKARHLLLQTAMPVTQVSLACGFESSQHFSKRYRLFFGKAPSHERSQLSR